ncbi:MAG: hypothetical protein HC888_17835 [Candidatus Competibacteraceae bacterium]|nr:hypothetical protein [Candidatus Competibacteraceae bacterium]
MNHQVPVQGFLGGTGPAIADFAIYAQFSAAALSGWTVDANRWPRLQAYLQQLQQRQCFSHSHDLAAEALANLSAHQDTDRTAD